MELHVTQFLSYRQTADVWNRQNPERTISHVTVGNIVKRVLAHYAEINADMLAQLRERQSQVIDQAMRVAWGIAVASKCVVCSGDRVVPKDKLDPDLGVQVCPKCDGSGRNEDDATRISALNTIRSLAERQARLFGLDAPVQVDNRATVTVALDVSGLSDEAIQHELEGMFKQPSVDATVVEELDRPKEDLVESLARPAGTPDTEPRSASPDAAASDQD